MKNAIIYFLIVILLGAGSFGYMQYSDKLDKLRKYSAKIDTLTETKEKFKDLYETSSREVSKIQSRNRELEQYLSERKEELDLKSDIIGQLSDSIKNINTVADTIFIDSSSVSVRTFSKYFDPFYISGYFEVQSPYRISFDSVSASINLEISYFKNDNDIWNTYVDTKSSKLVINNIKTIVKTQDKSFYDKLGIGAGVAAVNSSLSLYGRVSYDKLNLLTGYGTKGLFLGVDYNIK